MLFANTHNHSTFSDGVYTPEELIELGKNEGYGAVVLSDHDTVQGYYFMQKAARKAGLLTILACEFTTEGLGHDGEFHLLGYDFNSDEPEMRELLDYGAKRYREKTRLQLLWAQEAGRLTDITWEDVLNEFPYNDFICNNHIFRTLVKKGYAREDEYLPFFEDNFRWWLQPEERKKQLSQMPAPAIEDVIRIVLKAGGVPILAHPHNQEKFIPRLMEIGLLGLEVRHDMLTDDESKRLIEIADANKLYKTGGTDHNGILGGYLDFGEQYKVDPMKAGATEEEFMRLYKRELG